MVEAVEIIVVAVAPFGLDNFGKKYSCFRFLCSKMKKIRPVGLHLNCFMILHIFCSEIPVHFSCLLEGKVKNLNSSNPSDDQIEFVLCSITSISQMGVHLFEE